MQRDRKAPLETSLKDADGVRQPNHVDIHVGQQLRTRRRMMGFSQEQLALALGLTFQQIQKYERGTNRVSASKLYEAAKTFQVPVSYFFEGLADPTEEKKPDQEAELIQLEVQRFLALSESRKIVSQFPKLTKRAKVQVTALISALAGDFNPSDNVGGGKRR